MDLLLRLTILRIWILMCSFYVTVHGEKQYNITFASNWKDAVSSCQQMGKELANLNELLEYKSAGELQKYSSDDIMISSLIVETSSIAIKGCYNQSNSRPSFTLKSASPVSECFLYCQSNEGFAVSGRSCRCVASLSALGSASNASLCEHEHGQHKMNHFTVYKNFGDSVSGQRNPGVSYRLSVCRNIAGSPGIYSNFRHESQIKGSSFFPVCSGLDSQTRVLVNSPYKDWGSAKEACINKTGSYLAEDLDVESCNRFSKQLKDVYTKGTFWTGILRNTSKFYPEDLSVHKVSYKHSRCEVATSPNFNRTEQVACDQERYILCVQEEDRTSSKSGEAMMQTTTKPDELTSGGIIVVGIIVVGIIVAVIVFLILAIIFVVYRKRFAHTERGKKPKTQEEYFPSDEDVSERLKKPPPLHNTVGAVKLIACN